MSIELAEPLSDAILSDEDVRYLAVSMLRAESERDQQRGIGASDLSNPCDRCLGASMLGIERVSEHADRPYMGREIGSLIHAGLTEPHRVATANRIYPGYQAEQRSAVAEIPGYGIVPGTFDARPTKRHILDWKGSDRKKIALLEDCLQLRGMHRVGLAPRWEKQRDTKASPGGYKLKMTGVVYSLSGKDYEAEMAAMAYKVDWYFGQITTYIKSKGAARGSIVFIARDGTGFFDNPEFTGYDDPERRHDIFVLSFPFNQVYYDALVHRGAEIWALLQNQQGVGQLDPNPQCFFCKEEVEAASKLPAIEFAELGVPAVGAEQNQDAIAA